MTQPSSLASFAIQCRDKLASGRARIEDQFRSGLPSVQTANALSILYDEIVESVFDASIATAKEANSVARHVDQLVLVAHGGYGRRDLSPYSDADLMLLAPRVATAAAAQVAGSLVRDLNDAGFDVGFSVRTPSEACTLAWTDPKIYTSLTESRLLAGNETTYDRFFERFRAGARRRQNPLNAAAIQARREERRKWGETNYLLRPNVKRSRGALRDIQLVRWLGFAPYGETQLDALFRLGALTPDDVSVLRLAHAFMLRLRHELHFRAKRAQDILDRPTQLDIARDWGYTGRVGMLPVEEFMQDYFDHTRGVRYVAAFFNDDNRTHSRTSAIFERTLARRVDDDIQMGPTHIWVRAKRLEDFAKSLPDVLRLIQVANQHERRISHSTWQAIRLAMQEREFTPPDQASVDAFLSLLSHPGRLASLLRRLHELRILDQLIPAMRRCRGLLQFNAYHKYTVDAHCIRAVEAATDFLDHPGGMGRRYGRIKDKTLLHLALLIHDLGKGYDEDHSEVGRRIAGDVADSFGLSAHSKETLQWLIHKHLLINETAFRHDLNDAQVVHRFAAEVGSIEKLELLIVHSVADLMAVGPDVVNDWKMGLIEDLYYRTRRFFDTGNLPGDNEEELESKRTEIRNSLATSDAKEPSIKLLDTLPMSLLRQTDKQELTQELRQIGDWMDGQTGCFCDGVNEVAGSASRYTVVKEQGDRRIGAFARITGALSACGLVIMRANIETVGDNLLWDTFWVTDLDCPGAPPKGRIDQVCDAIRKALNEPESPLPPARKIWKSGNKCEPERVNLLPTKVTFDNTTFDHQTILSLFAYDRPGLLFEVADVLAGTGVSIQFAKIDTHLDQIADVFYVTNEAGEPIVSEDHQAEIREALLAAFQTQSE